MARLEEIGTHDIGFVVGFIAFVVLCFAIVFGLIFGLSYALCAQFSEQTGYQGSFWLFSGCFVSIDNQLLQ